MSVLSYPRQMLDGFQVDPAALSGVSDDLDGAGRNLFAHRDDLCATPDAGRSSGEVADAFAGLGDTLAALAQHIGSMADQLDATVASYQQTDLSVQGRLDELRGVR